MQSTIIQSSADTVVAETEGDGVRCMYRHYVSEFFVFYKKKCSNHHFRSANALVFTIFCNHFTVNDFGQGEAMHCSAVHRILSNPRTKNPLLYARVSSSFSLCISRDY